MSRSYRRKRRHRLGRPYRKSYRRSDQHHIRPRAAGGTNAPENVIVLDRRVHELIHGVFGAMPPEQYLPYIKRNPSVAIFKLVRGIARTFGPGVVEAALKEAAA